MTIEDCPYSVRPISRLGWTGWPHLSAPLISIVTVFRRDFAELQSTLESLHPFAQHAIEWVVIEGDSQINEDSRRIQSMAIDMGLAVKWCVYPDKGIYDAMNRGILASQGDWIWFLNAGDTLSTSLSVSALTDVLQEAETSYWLVGDVDILNAEGRPRYTSSYASARGLAWGTEPVCHQGVLVRRSALALIGLFDTTYRVSADYKSLLKLEAHGQPYVYKHVVSEFRLGGASSVQGAQRERENLRAREEVLRRTRLVRARDHLRCAWRQMLLRSIMRKHSGGSL